MPNRYEEQSDLISVLTSRVDKYGRITGLAKHRGRYVRVLILVKNPLHPTPVDLRKP